MIRVDKTQIHLANFPFKSIEKIRWSDTDARGHVNNQNYAAYCETGRLEMFRDFGIFSSDRKADVFIARLAIDFHSEVTWPGEVEVGTGIKAIGRSSITISQAIFQNGRCAASVEVVMVYVDKATHKPMVMDDEIKKGLNRYMLAQPLVWPEDMARKKL